MHNDWNESNFDCVGAGGVMEMIRQIVHVGGDACS